MDNTLNEILEKISLICKKNDWTLYRLSKESGIPYSSLRNMFKRNAYPSFINLKKICRGLRIKLSEFFQYVEEPPSLSDYTKKLDIYIVLSDDEKLLLENYRNMNKKKKRLLLLYMSGLLDKKPN